MTDTSLPLARGTQNDDGLVPAFAFDPAAAGRPELGDEFVGALDAIDLGEGAPAWLVATARLIRPLSVGALMAIPTVGTATIGAVALFSRERALAMSEASVAFLQGLPTDIILLIGTLATGYGVSRSIEKLKGKSR